MPLQAVCINCHDAIFSQGCGKPFIKGHMKIFRCFPLYLLVVVQCCFFVLSKTTSRQFPGEERCPTFHLSFFDFFLCSQLVALLAFQGSCGFLCTTNGTGKVLRPVLLHLLPSPQATWPAYWVTLEIQFSRFIYSLNLIQLQIEWDRCDQRGLWGHVLTWLWSSVWFRI